MSKWLQYHYGWQDGVACRQEKWTPADVSRCHDEYQRGYGDAFKLSVCFLNENYQPPKEDDDQ